MIKRYITTIQQLGHWWSPAERDNKQMGARMVAKRTYPVLQVIQMLPCPLVTLVVGWWIRGPKKTFCSHIHWYFFIMLLSFCSPEQISPRPSSASQLPTATMAPAAAAAMVNITSRCSGLRPLYINASPPTPRGLPSGHPGHTVGFCSSGGCSTSYRARMHSKLAVIWIIYCYVQQVSVPSNIIDIELLCDKLIVTPVYFAMSLNLVLNSQANNF